MLRTIFDLVLLWIVMAIVVSKIAGSKGYESPTWFLYGILIWPIAIVHILILPKTPIAIQKAIQKKAEAEGRKPCPFCAEFILANASVCPHCQRDLNPSWSVNDPSEEKGKDVR